MTKYKVIKTQRFIFVLLFLIVVTFILIGCKSVTSDVDNSALSEADRYFSMLKTKWAGTEPGSIVSISEIKEVKETSTGYEFTVVITFYNGLVQKNYLEIDRTGNGSFVVVKMRNY